MKVQQFCLFDWKICLTMTIQVILTPFTAEALPSHPYIKGPISGFVSSFLFSQLWKTRHSTFWLPNSIIKVWSFAVKSGFYLLYVYLLLQSDVKLGSFLKFHVIIMWVVLLFSYFYLVEEIRTDLVGFGEEKEKGFWVLVIWICLAWGS